MDDFISREAAKEAAVLIAMTSVKREMTCGEVKKIMNDIPPADVVSRSDVIQALYNALYIKCGRWIDSKGIEQMCTELWALIEGLLPSCHCGAVMRPEPEKERSDE